MMTLRYALLVAAVVACVAMVMELRPEAQAAMRYEYQHFVVIPYLPMPAIGSDVAKTMNVAAEDGWEILSINTDRDLNWQLRYDIFARRPVGVTHSGACKTGAPYPGWICLSGQWVPYAPTSQMKK